MYDHMQKLEGADPLAKLFNQYLAGLSTIMVLSEPSYTTMADLREHTETKPRTDAAKTFRNCAQRYYELLILRNSLRSIHGHVLGAITLLESFYTTYGDNLLAFAFDTRLKSINEYGSDDESDWQEVGLDEQGGQKWEITHKDDPESLKTYTLHAELGQFFGGESCGRGEYIGTSTVDDFYKSTSMVAQQSELSFRKMAEGAWGISLVRVAEDGSTEPLPLADQIEAEMNPDIKAADVIARFDGALQLARLLRDFYLKMEPNNLDACAQLLKGLQIMRDVKLAL